MHLSHKQAPIPGDQTRNSPSKTENPEVCAMLMAGSQHLFQSTDPLLSIHILANADIKIQKNTKLLFLSNTAVYFNRIISAKRLNECSDPSLEVHSPLSSLHTDKTLNS